MEERLLLSQEKILNKKFSPNVKGYDAEEVDDFLDQVIIDYRSFENFTKEVMNYIKSLELENKKLKDDRKSLEVENGKMKQRLGGIKEGDHVTRENIDLLKRIDKLERALYAKGVDPSKLK